MEKMEAYVFKDVGNLVLEEKPISHVKDPDDVLLKVRAVGICGSDLKIIEGKHHFKPKTPPHLPAVTEIPSEPISYWENCA
ncbi:MAG: alcohol dehydrogenase catalytic domain-containing protein [Anaerolineales bacterium]|nr:alcohol dehydrogenase catalytic domain-containing protein [Anaerolineales bacterium]